jgi:hypothetical protein
MGQVERYQVVATWEEAADGWDVIGPYGSRAGGYATEAAAAAAAAAEVDAEVAKRMADYARQRPEIRAKRDVEMRRMIVNHVAAGSRDSALAQYAQFTREALARA